MNYRRLSSGDKMCYIRAMPPSLSIVVLNWNVAELLAACLRSLPDATGEWWSRSEVIVVDNASTDGSAEMVLAQFPGVRFIALPTNRGFTGGNNAGILAARGEYVFLLNPDTVAQPGSIAALAGYLAEHTETGIAGPRLLNPDGTLQSSRRRFPTLATALLESTPLQRWSHEARALRRFYMLDTPEGETQGVDWLSGAALMCRRDALRQAGLFDPGYFMFSEEVDLCRRVKDAGWRVMYIPEAGVIHYGGQSTGQDVPARHIHFNTGKARYFRIHEGRLFGALVRRYLLLVYLVQLISEAVKWLLGHKRPLRAERIRMYLQVLRSGLCEHKPPSAGQARVLLISGEYPPARGGVGDYTCALGTALQARGVNVQVLAQTPGRSKVQSPKSKLESNPKSKIQNPKSLRVSRITFSAALRALRGSRSGIVHIQYQTGAYGMRPTVNILPWRLRRRWGGATVVTLHDLRVPYLFPKAGPLREWANRVMARSAAACIATNPEDAARLRSWGVEWVRLIPIGSNIPNNPPEGYDRAAWREAHGASERTILLAYFGFLNSTKGLDDLLRALSALRERGDFRLLMVGGGLGSSDPTNRATAQSLDALAGDLNVRDRLIWTGYLSPREVSAALLSADIAVLPYTDGATFRRGSLIAALEHALPVITTRPVSGSESSPKSKVQSPKWDWPRLAHGDNAFLAEPGDSPALTEAIYCLAKDDALRARLAVGSSELARFFSWERIAAMHEELYTELSA